MSGGVSGWLRSRLLKPEYPALAVEVRPRSIGVVRLAREGKRQTLGAAASIELPEGTLALSMTEPNIVAPDVFRQALRAVLERAGAAGGGRAALVLPDPVARVALVAASEIPARGAREVEELLRFRLKKAVPFEIRQARLAWLSPEGAGGSEASLLVAAVSQLVLEGYEQACHGVGLLPGLVEVSGLAIWNAVEGARAPADRLIVNWDDGYVSLILARAGWPVLVRTLTGEGASDPANVVREVGQTVLYYRERLGGGGLAQAVVRSAAIPPEEAIVLLEEPLGIAPEALDPWGPLAGERGATAQALAGAVACVVGRAA